MLGGFNLVKRENHLYKYAHCANIKDVKYINNEYKNDLYSNNWRYPLPSLSNAIEMDSWQSVNLFTKSSIVNFEPTSLPNLVKGWGMFSESKNLSKIDLELPKCTHLGNSWCGNWQGMFSVCSSLTEAKLDIPKTFNVNALFIEDSNLEIVNLKNASSITVADNICRNCKKLKSFKWDATNVHHAYTAWQSCILDKESILGILSALAENPTKVSNYASSEGVGKTTLGINGNLSGDAEIQSELLAAKQRGWTITIQLNGKVTKDEVINSEKIAKLELDSITLPYGYRRCEYLESDTNNQYIDTEIIPTNTTGTWIIAKRITETIDGCSIAVRTDSNYYYPPVLRSNGNYHGWGTTTEWTDFTKQNTAFESYINYPIDGTIVKEAVAIDNAGTSVTKALTTELPTISHSLYIFGRNYNGTLERQWNGRIYRVKISEGDQIIRDFIPALDPDGKPCMYEMIEGKPYYNAATSGNDFLYKVYEDYVMPELPPYDIVEGSKYIPDASSWNSTAYAELTTEDKTIIRVVNGIAYDE